MNNQKEAQLNVDNLIDHKVRDYRKIGAWLSATLSDPQVCDEFKKDIRDWMDRFAIVEDITGIKVEDFSQQRDATEREGKGEPVVNEYFCTKCQATDVVSDKFLAWMVCKKCGHTFSRQEFLECKVTEE